MLIESYSDLRCIVPHFFQSESALVPQRTEIWIASFQHDQEVSGIFPYINGALDDAVYYAQPEHVRFLLDGYRCVVYPHTSVAYYFESKTDAMGMVERLVAFLNTTDDRKETIVPSYDQLKRIPVFDILKVLPQTNCRQCGYPTCMAFAAGIYKGRVSIERCPHLAGPISEKAVYPVFNEEGAIENTVALPISTSDLKNTIQAQQSRIAMLEAALGAGHFKVQASPKRPVQPSRANDYGLTTREIEVLRLIAEGYTNNEIAGVLFVSPHTVKSHMINIFNKMNVSDRTRAAVLATREQLI